MAIYSASLKTISRRAGRSGTAAAAYRLGCEIADERTGQVFDYTRRSGVEATFSFAKGGLATPDPATLWNLAEIAEKRKDATVAREMVVALPHELDQSQRLALVQAISQALADRYGIAGSVGLHLPDTEGDQRNHHAHILMTTRVYDGEAMGAKTRVLDDRETGPQETLWMRQMVEELTNAALERAGLDARVDCRSLADQRAAALEEGDLSRAEDLDRLPTIHLGPKVTQILREAQKEGREPLGKLDRAKTNQIRLALVEAKAEVRRLDNIISFEEAKQRIEAKKVAPVLTPEDRGRLAAKASHQMMLIDIDLEKVRARKDKLHADYDHQRDPDMAEWHAEALASLKTAKAAYIAHQAKPKTLLSKVRAFFGIKSQEEKAYIAAKSEVDTAYPGQVRAYKLEKWLAEKDSELKDRIAALKKDREPHEKVYAEHKDFMPRHIPTEPVVPVAEKSAEVGKAVARTRSRRYEPPDTLSLGG